MGLGILRAWRYMNPVRLFPLAVCMLSGEADGSLTQSPAHRLITMQLG